MGNFSGGYLERAGFERAATLRRYRSAVSSSVAVPGLRAISNACSFRLTERREMRIAFFSRAMLVGLPAFFLLNSIFCIAVITFPADRKNVSVLKFSPTSK